MHVKEFDQLLIEISSLLEKISRGLYYERIKLSYTSVQQSTPKFAPIIYSGKFGGTPSSGSYHWYKYLLCKSSCDLKNEVEVTET